MRRRLPGFATHRAARTSTVNVGQTLTLAHRAGRRGGRRDRHRHRRQRRSSRPSARRSARRSTRPRSRTCRSTAATSSTSCCTTPGVTRDVRARRHQLRRPARHAQQPGRRRRRQQQHVLRPDARPHRLGPRAVPVQPGRGAGVPGQPQRLLGRVRPRRRRGHQRRHQVGHQRLPRLGCSSSTATRRSTRTTAINELEQPRRSRPYHFDQFGGGSAARSSATGTSSSSTTTGSATRSRTTVVPQRAGRRRPATPRRRPASRSCSRSPTSWDARRRTRTCSSSRPTTSSTDEPPADAALQPPELHRRELRERRHAATSLEHTGDSRCYTRTFNATLASVARRRRCSTRCACSGRKDQEPGVANSDDPRRRSARAARTCSRIGRNFFSPRETTIKRWQVADTLTWVRGAHTLQGRLRRPVATTSSTSSPATSPARTPSTASPLQRGVPNGAGERYVQAFAGPGTTGPTTHPEHQRVRGLRAGRVARRRRR